MLVSSSASAGGGAASAARRGVGKRHRVRGPSGSLGATRQGGFVTTPTGLRLLGVERARARGTSVRVPVVAGATPGVMPDAGRLRAERVAKTVEARPRRVVCAARRSSHMSHRQLHSSLFSSRSVPGVRNENEKRALNTRSRHSPRRGERRTRRTRSPAPIRDPVAQAGGPSARAV